MLRPVANKEQVSADGFLASRRTHSPGLEAPVTEGNVEFKLHAVGRDWLANDSSWPASRL
jgi:hypothetical protein